MNQCYYAPAIVKRTNKRSTSFCTRCNSFPPPSACRSYAGPRRLQEHQQQKTVESVSHQQSKQQHAWIVPDSPGLWCEHISHCHIPAAFWKVQLEHIQEKSRSASSFIGDTNPRIRCCSALGGREVPSAALAAAAAQPCSSSLHPRLPPPSAAAARCWSPALPPGHCRVHTQDHGACKSINNKKQ